PPSPRHGLGIPGQDHVVGRGLPYVGDYERTDDHDAQADRGEHERGGAGIVPEEHERDDRPDGHPDRPGKVEHLPQECPAYRRNASMKLRKSRPSIAASIGRMIALSIPKRPDASPDRKRGAASTHSSAVTPTPFRPT